MGNSYTNGAFFDLDGTIANTLPLIYRTYEELFNRHAELGGNADKAISLLGLPLTDILSNVLETEVVESLVTEYLEIYKVLHDQLLQPYDGIFEALSEIKHEGFYLGVVTSKARETTMLAIDRLGFNGFFDSIITAEDTPAHKPSPEPILTALRNSGISPMNAVYIGDSPYDVLSSKSAGVRVIAVTWGAFKRTSLIIENPDICIDFPSQLSESILSLYGK